MQTVILAAGDDVRSRAFTRSCPTAMLPVAGAPAVEQTARAAVEAGAEKLVFVVGIDDGDVRAHFGDALEGVPVSYAVQTRRAGTADAVRAAAGRLDGPFVVLNGDNCYATSDLEPLYEGPPRVGVAEVAHPDRYGVVEVDDGAVVDAVEKPDDPQGRLVSTGAYAFPGEATNWLDVPVSDRGERELTDVLRRVADEYVVEPVEFDGWHDVSRPWKLLDANRAFLADAEGSVQGDVATDAHVSGTVVVEPGASIRSGSVVEGPAYVSAGAEIGPNAYVHGATHLGADVRVGHAVEVENSVLMAGTRVGHLSYVGDSLVGRDVDFGAGTTVANRRHDDRPVVVTVNGERWSTDRSAFGVVVGHEAKTGINTSLDAGVTLGAGATTVPGQTVVRDKNTPP